jgi:hypothetical protein
MAYSQQTVLWIRETPDAIWRQLNVINSGRKFKNVPLSAIFAKAKKRYPSIAQGREMDHSYVQRLIAEDIADGWKRNGPWPYAEFRIEQGT